MLTCVGAQASPSERSRHERGQGNQGSDYRKFCDARNGKAKEKNVAGHVAHEHVAQCEKADRVDQACDHRQDEKQQRQRTVPAFRQESDGTQGACDDQRRMSNAMRVVRMSSNGPSSYTLR